MDDIRLFFPDQFPKTYGSSDMGADSVADNGEKDHVHPCFLQGIKLGLDESADTSDILVAACYKNDFHFKLFQYHSQACWKPVSASNFGL